MTIEALYPHALRYTIHRAAIEDIDATTADHEIEIDADGEGTLPDSVIRRTLDHSFLPEIPRSSFSSFQDYNRSRYDNLMCYYAARNDGFFTSCEGDNGTLDRSFAGITKSAASNDVNGFTALAALTDVGKRVVIVDADAETSLNAIVVEVQTSSKITAGNYRVGSIASAITASDAAFYETTLELVRSGTCEKSPGTLAVTDNEAEATESDEGKLIIISVSGIVVIRAVIEEYVSAGTFRIFGYLATEVIGGTFEIYRILDPVILLNAPTVTALPDDAETDIPMSARILDNVILTLAGALTGEIKIAELLDQKIP
jgi:hypothetical protein